MKGPFHLTWVEVSSRSLRWQIYLQASKSRLAAEHDITYINNLSIMRLPTLNKRPGIVFFVPYFEAVVGAGSHHACAKIVEVNGEHEVLMAMREGLKVALCCHVCIGVMRSNKAGLELLYDALVNAARAAVGVGLLDQRGDQVGVLKHIFKGHCEVEMGLSMMGERTRVQPCFVACGAERGRVAYGRRGQPRRGQIR